MNKSTLCPLLAAVCFTLTSAVLFISPANAANANAQKGKITLNDAHKIVRSYRELRESCAQGNYDERRACVRELSSVSEQYRAAKDIIATHKLTGSTVIASY